MTLPEREPANKLAGWLGRPWLLLPIALAAACASSYFFWALQQDYWLDWRHPTFHHDWDVPYTLIDATLFVWSIVGVVVVVLSVRTVATRRPVAGWTYRSLILYFALCLLLAVGISVLAFARSRGFLS